MAKKEKACLNCRAIYEGESCPNCGESVTTDVVKGRVHIFNSEKSEVAKNMKINGNGEFTIKTK